MTDASPRIDPALVRYSRQVLVPEIGEAGQHRLLRAKVTLIGCGALGTAIANTLVRAGVGSLRICDRDYIEPDNLQRQILFDEQDIADGLPKAEAAAQKLRRINREVSVEAVVTDVNHGNVERLCEDADLLLDGTDNFETRYLINDLAVKYARPWVYGAVLATTGLCMPVIPGRSPCLRCVFPESPPADLNPSCDTAGVLSPAVNVVAACQAMEAIKILIDRTDAVIDGLVQIDVWTGRWTVLNVKSAEGGIPCPCCVAREFEYLDGRRASVTVSLCGRNAVQVCPPGRSQIDARAMADKLRRVADAVLLANDYMTRVTVGNYEVTVFGDGRAIIKGTDSVEDAKSLYARYVGS